MKKLWKVIEAIQEILQGTAAKVTLEWPDGRRVVITRHVYAVRRPEKLLMEPVDTLELHDPILNESTFVLNEQADNLRQTWSYMASPFVKHDKIQGDENIPWIKDGDQHTP